MNDKINVTLSLPERETVSNLKMQIYNEDLKSLNNKFPLYKNQVDIKKTYIISNGKILEVGFFVRNGLENKLSVEVVPIVVRDSKGKTIVAEKINLKEFGVIPPLSARPYTGNFQMEYEVSSEELEKCDIDFFDVNRLEAYNSVPTEIDDLPMYMSFEEEQEIKEFIRKLPTLKEDDFTLSVFKLNQDESGNLICSFLLRNGHNSEASLEKIPISIVNEFNETIARRVFENKSGFIKIGSRKSKFFTIEFKSNEINGENYDVSKCKVVLK
jgi:SLAP domain-containing protein